jgi:hypothetical protein
MQYDETVSVQMSRPCVFGLTPLLNPTASLNIRRTLHAGWIHGEQITTYAEHLQEQQDTIEQKILLLPTVFMDRLEKTNTHNRAFASALRILNAQVHCMHLNMSFTYNRHHQFSQMARWFPSTNIFGLRKIIVPVNMHGNTHWGVLCVDFRLHHEFEKMVF